MSKRRPMKKSHSKSDFRKKSGVHPKNGQSKIMRGGIRF
nr:MAG: hypothetical protein [Microvirus sp.]QJB19676.1 MAG: hypothetical protein [Microvirus sp.]